MKNPWKIRSKKIRQVTECKHCNDFGKEIIDCRKCKGLGCRSCNMTGDQEITCRTCKGSKTI